MSHKCAKIGCGFHLPDTYPLPFCPWHTAPGKGVVKLIGAAGIFAFGVGGAYAYGKLRGMLRERRIETEQHEWRQKAEKMQTPGERQEGDDPIGSRKSA